MQKIIFHLSSDLCVRIYALQPAPPNFFLRFVDIHQICPASMGGCQAGRSSTVMPMAAAILYRVATVGTIKPRPMRDILPGFKRE